MNRRVRKWIPICNSAHSLNVVSCLENGSTKHTKFHWLGGSTINAQAHVSFKVWRKDDIDQLDEVHQLALDEHSQPLEKEE